MALTDREIWELGWKYVPNQEYLLNPFRTPTTTDDDDETQPGDGIPNTYNYGIPNTYNYDSDRTSTAARMPNQYIDYLDKNRRTRKNNPLEKGIGFLKNTSIGQGVGAAYGILQDIMPMNKTAIMNNEMLGQGFAVDNTGKLVRVDQGDVDTAGNIMAGYNVSKMDEETFDDRIDNLKMKLGPRRNARIAAIKAAKAAWMRANVQTGKVYHDKYKDREDYRMLDTKYEEEMNDPGKLTPDQLEKGYIRSRGANIDAGHWVDEGHTLKDIKEDVTGKYTDDPSGLSGIDDAPGPSYNDDWNAMGDFNRGGRVGLNYGGLASILSREGSADGGRIGFFEGGDMSAEDWAAAEAYGDSLPDPSWSVDNNPPDNIDNNVVDTGNNVVDVDLLSTKPSVEITPTDYQKYMANLDLINSIKEQELEGQVGATIGPVDFTTMIEGGGIGNTNLNYGNWSANISPDADINQISYNRNIGDWELAANYGDGNYGINLSKPFKHGGLARLL